MFLATAAAAATMMMAPAQDRAPYQSERVAPRGSFAQSCSGAYTNQGRLYADCRDERGRVRGEVANLQYEGFNDAVSSMELRGRWEVCTDANFRGYCQIVDGSVRNLDRWGLNDRISSMRPVRGGGRGW